jgi:hypothetical protein
MKKFLIAAAGAAMAVTAMPAVASAAPGPNNWTNINQRQANLERRIDVGVRNGSLTRREATMLRSEFRSLERLEYRYRRSGGVFTLAERRDLDRRFDILSRKIRTERHDRQTRNDGRGKAQYGRR